MGFTYLLKNYTNWDGRVSVGTFWKNYLSVVIVLGVLWGVGSALATAGAANDSSGLALIGLLMYGIAGLASLAYAVPMIALSIRRLHDTGKPAVMILLGLIPFVGGLILLVLYVLPSQPQDNQFGAYPAE